MEPKPTAAGPAIAKRAAAKRTAAPPKVYPAHEHFGSPLNVCRVCGEKYTYTQKPYTLDGLSNSKQ